MEIKKMTDYELTKRNDIAGWKLRPYIIRVETDDLDFLNFMDKKTWWIDWRILQRWFEWLKK